MTTPISPKIRKGKSRLSQQRPQATSILTATIPVFLLKSSTHTQTYSSRFPSAAPSLAGIYLFSGILQQGYLQLDILPISS